MANEQLKAALRTAGLQPDDLAEIIEVDVKTVRRWLYGARPYPRHRVRIAQALNATEQDLWPESAPVPPTTARPNDRPANADAPRDEPEPGLYSDLDHLALIESATQRIDLVLAWWDHILDTPEVITALERKHASGCQVRVITTDPDHFDERAALPAFEFRELDEFDQAFSIHRYDNQILAALAWFSRDPERDTLPIIRLSAQHNPGTYQGFAEHIEMFWPDPTASDNGPDNEPEPDPTDPAQRHELQLPPTAPPEPSPQASRRWPGRRPEER